MARRIVVELLGDSSSLERSFARSSRSAKKFQSDMKGLSGGVLRGVARGAGGGIGLPIFGGGATVAGAVGAGAVVAGIKKSISAASDLNEQIGKTEVVFGKSGKAVEDWSKTLTNSFALSERQALATASSFGALFRPLGITGEEAAKQSEKLTELGADLASFYNTDVQSALDAIKSGIVGEAEPLRQYGVQLSETRVQQEALVETGKKHAAALTMQEKAAARLVLIFRDSAPAQGDSARSQQRLAEQTKILSANIDTLAAKIGQKLLPAATDATTALNELLSPTGPGKKPSETKKDVSALGDAYQWVAHGLGAVKDNSDAFDKLLGFPKTTFLEKTNPFFAAAKAIRLSRQLLGREEPVISTGKMDPEAAVKMAHGLGLVADAAKKVGDATAKFRATATQRNTWFDAIIGRQLSRVSDAPINEQLGMLQRISAAISKRLAITKDITRQLTLEDQLYAIAQQKKQVRADLQQAFFDRLQLNVDRTSLTKTVTDDLAQLAIQQRAIQKRVQIEGHTLELDQMVLSNQQARAGKLEEQAAAAQAAREAAQAEALAWADFAEERAAATKPLQDDLKRAQEKLKLLQKQAGVGKKTAEQARTIWEQQQKVNEIRKKMRADDDSGFRHLTSSQIVGALGAGVSPAATRRIIGLLSTIGPRGSAPRSTGQFALAGGVSIGVVNVHGVQNVAQLNNELVKHAKGRSKVRRGARG